MKFEAFLKSVTKVTHLNLPGEVSQFKMIPPYREDLIKNHDYDITTAKQAAVMALFYQDINQNTKLVLILRKTYKGVHSAQVGFPGGKVEPEDKNLQETALRETFEEVGVGIEEMTVVKALTKIYIPPSHFNVFPFLGYCTKTPQLKKQEEEVEAILEVNIDAFLDDKNLTAKQIKKSEDLIYNVPAIHLNGHLVWGATAMMLSEVKDLLKEVL